MNSNTGAIRRMRAARAFITRGWPVFPLTPGAKQPLRHCPLCSVRSPDYVQHRGVDDCPHPADYCHGFHVASTDENRLVSWFERFPEMNIGIATGPARLVVIDLDTNKDGDDVPAPYNLPGVHDGRDVFALCLERYEQPFPGDTLSVLTPSGGLHLYWRLPKGVIVNKSEGKFGWNIDVRAAGSYIVAPTCTTPEGEYRRLGDIHEPVGAPAWLLHHLEGTGHMPKPPAPRRPYKGPVRAADDRGKTTLADLAAQLASAPVGQRHRILCSTTTAAAYLVQAGRYTETEVYAELEIAGRAADRSDGEIHAALESAFTLVARRGAA